MKKTYLYIAIALLVAIIILMRNCKQDIEIIIPEIEGDFKPEIPSHKPIIDTIYITKWEEVIVKTKNPVNDSLAKAYVNARDSIEMYKMYISAIEIRDFAQTFEDSIQRIDVFGKVQGEIKSISSRYKIKERTIDITTAKQSKRNRFGIGVSAGYGVDGVYAGIGVNYNIIQF